MTLRPTIAEQIRQQVSRTPDVSLAQDKYDLLVKVADMIADMLHQAHVTLIKEENKAYAIAMRERENPAITTPRAFTAD